MLGAVRAVFGPSRADRRRAAAAYLDELRLHMPGETLAQSDIFEDYERFSAKCGAPKLSAEALMLELALLGCESFEAIRVPWPIRPNGGDKSALPAPAAEPTASPAAKPKPEKRTVRQITARKRPRIARDDALAEVQARLQRGETIPSQKALADLWGMTPPRVSEWFTAWRAAGLVPEPVREERCNVFYLRPEHQLREAS